MGVLDYFRPKPKKSANKAKERLQIIVAHERSMRQGAEYLPKLKEEILQVIRKYVEVDQENVNVVLDKKDDDCQILELNITLPDNK